MKTTGTRAPEDTRRRILKAAFGEFYRNGFQGGSLNRIVEGAGTTKGALFHHFEGKRHWLALSGQPRTPKAKNCRNRPAKVCSTTWTVCDPGTAFFMFARIPTSLFVSV